MIGRKKELEIIKNAIQSKKAELGIVYGRRRIGKSTLLESLVQSKRDLYFEGIQGLSGKKQIAHFVKQLSDQTDGLPYHASTWNEAFDILTKFIVTKQHYVVFDEFPWMASEKSELVSILKFYWDRYWKKNANLTLVICGSIAQFMVKHLIHSAALHNRKTFEIKLEPLSANESKNFFKGFRSQNEMANFLMTFGGIPKYLEQVNPKESFSVNINRLCLVKNAFFLNEFESIFKEQFKVSKTYEDIVIELKKNSLSKEQLAKKLKITDGGGFKKYLDNLENADFIKSFIPAQLIGQENKQKKSKTKKYYLWDEWINFYLTFIQPNQKAIELNKHQNLFTSLIEKKSSMYFGLCFEKLCMKNMSLILEYLNIPADEVSNYGPFFRQRTRGEHSSEEKGLQIDILIIRKRHLLTLIECKYSDSPIGKGIIVEVEKKIKMLKAPKRYSIERILICSNGITSDLEEEDYFHQVIPLDFLF